jgi:hypothetical protein
VHPRGRALSAVHDDDDEHVAERAARHAAQHVDQERPLAVRRHDERMPERAESIGEA